MILPWISLAVAADANASAHDAKDKANEANSNSRTKPTMLIVRPVDLESVPTRKPAGFWDVFISSKNVLGQSPWATLGIKVSDVQNLREYKDDDGVPYVRIQISEYANVCIDGDHVIGLKVPGTIEEISKIING